MNYEAGKSKVGCLIYISLFTIAVILVFTIAPTYVEKVALEEELMEAVNRAGANNWDDNTIRNEVIELSIARGFELNRKDIRISRDPRSRPVRKIRLGVDFRKTIGFSSYKHTLEFNYQDEGLIGRI
jgi:hypothetical protein